MERTVSRGRRLQFLFLAALLLLLPFGWYYFFYVSSQQVYLTDRNFRLLALMSRHIQSRVEYIGNLAWKSVTNKIEDLKQLSRPQTRGEVEKLVKDTISLVPALRLDSVGATDSLPDFEVKRKGETFAVYFRYRSVLDKVYTEADAYTVEVTASTDLNSLLTPILSRPEFDDILVVQQKDRKVIFQRATSGTKVTTLPVLLEEDKKEGSDSEFPLLSSRLFETRLAGARYKLFLQPLQLSLSTDEKTEEWDWIICGLVRSDRFLSESLTISPTILVLFIFVILMVALTWPFLNLWFMEPRDRLSVADVFFLVFSVLVGSALVTLLLLNADAYMSLERRMDVQLKTFADDINNHLHAELNSIHQQLTEISTSVDISEHLDDSQLSNILANDAPIDWSIYPYFEFVFWVDSNGHQRKKWTVKDKTTPLINVYERSYVRSVLEDRLWSRTLAGKPVGFWVEPIYSWNTGENLTVYSLPMPASASGPAKARVAALVTRPLSLTQPVVPPGFGYAVITDDGSVLFHLDETRNLQEKFFAESDENDVLRSVVFGRSTEWINAQYWGRDCRLYVRPLDDLPWSLVVYRDKELLGTANLELLTVAVMLFIFHASLLIGFVLLYFWSSGDRVPWLWPTPGHTGVYYQLTGINLLGGVIFCLGISVLADWPGLIVCLALLLPALEIVLIYAVLRKGLVFPIGFFHLSEVSRKRGSRLFRVGYVLAATSVFILVGVLPAFAFFKVAYDKEMELLVKHGQLQLARAIENRAGRVGDQYLPIQVNNKSQFLDKRLKLGRCDRSWEERDNSLRLDIYGSFFFDTVLCEDSIPEKRANPETVYSFDWVLSQIKPLYNRASVELRGVLGPGAADNLWVWKRELSRLELDKEWPGKDHGLRIVSTIPALEIPGGVLWWIGPVFLFTLLCWAVRVIAQRVFLLDFLDPPNPGFQVLSAQDVSRNLLVLGPPFSGKSALLQRADSAVLDLRRLGEQWFERIKYEDLAHDTHRVIAIDHFEHGMGDPQQDREKLRLLEELLSSCGKPLVVASAIDPVEFYCSAQATRTDQAENHHTLVQERYSWAGIFSSFWEVYIDDEGNPAVFSEALSRARTQMLAEEPASSPAARRERRRIHDLFQVVARECSPKAYLQDVGQKIVLEPTFAQFTPGELREIIWDQSHVYYHAVWATCSKGEQFLLGRIARDHFVNSRNPDLRRLLRKRLILRDPGLRIMNESFEQFVRSALLPEDLTAWEQQERSGGWNALKGPLLVVLIGAGFFLYMTQRELFNATSAFASAIAAGGMPALLKLAIAFFHEDKAKQ
jgi:hypothetical protein